MASNKQDLTLRNLRALKKQMDADKKKLAKFFREMAKKLEKK